MPPRSELPEPRAKPARRADPQSPGPSLHSAARPSRLLAGSTRPVTIDPFEASAEHRPDPRRDFAGLAGERPSLTNAWLPRPPLEDERRRQSRRESARQPSNRRAICCTRNTVRKRRPSLPEKRTEPVVRATTDGCADIVTTSAPHAGAAPTIAAQG